MPIPNLEECKDYENQYGTLIDGTTARSKDCIDISKITSRIFLGSYDAGAKMLEGLKLFGVTHTLTVGHNMPPVHEEHFKYKVFSFEDHHSVDISKYFPECFTFIDEALSENNTNKVLIHCYAGVSRSATVTIAYLIHKNLMSYEESIEYVRKARHWINPNGGFRRRLKNLVKSLGIYDSKSSKRYEEAGKVLRVMHEKKTITVRNRDIIINTFEEIFGLLHPHTLDISIEMDPFVAATTI